MGRVFRAHHVALDETVAIKVLRPQLALDATSVRRFVREAKSSARLKHPHCVRVTDFATTEAGAIFMVMEYLDGRTVARELSVDGVFAPKRMAHVGAQVACALGHAHSLGLLHRDLKPENLLLVRRQNDPDFAVVLDFGLAKLIDGDAPMAQAISLAGLTRDGISFGTPEYMSPEQAIGASFVSSERRLQPRSLLV